VNIRAVIFDYFGTLTVNVSASVRRSGASQVASALGIPADIFFDTISSTFTERATGQCGDMMTTMAWVAHRCGYQPSPTQLAAACAKRSEIEGRYARMIRPEAAEVLRRLSGKGLRVGVVSDCTHELPDCWERLAISPWVDATIFSVEIGQRKPHPSLYLGVCERLDIAPAEAIYVGDGGSNELTGARAVGMRAIRIVSSDAAEAFVYDAEPNWNGPIIESLTALTSDPPLST
jgi:putative hydrolase of the HAD superfamily